ncbi:protein Flattop homolog [Mytilus trossulus]|uniref:protein Flattop homolog n=1 Tax=Mytilus trossulus TaxID=6551 RepID=UPI003005ABD1
MSLHFSANQYTNAFDPVKLQNWQVAREYRERPRSFDGFTQIVANNRGHLIPGVKRSRDSPWGTFVGTWDMPLKIPGNTNPTARSGHAVESLLRSKTDGDIVLRGKLKRCKVPDALRVKEDIKADGGIGPGPFETLLMNGSGGRSGARNPEPISTSPKMPPIGYKPMTPTYRSKPPTPTLNWPHPQSPARSAGSRRSGQYPATTNCAVAGTYEPDMPVLSSRTPINWPSPKSYEPPVQA